MSILFHQIIGVLSLICALLLLLAFAYGHGYDDGYTTADNWWIRGESEIDDTRVQMWREEAHL